jgi:hypothetical protein
MNAEQRKLVTEVVARTSEALDQLRLVEERQGLANRPRLVRVNGASVDHERDEWEMRVFWQGAALWIEDPELMVFAIREVMRARPEHFRWRLHKLCQQWAQIGGPDWPTLGPANGPWSASLKGVLKDAPPQTASRPYVRGLKAMAARPTACP